ncbi:hypothetical protein C6P45_003693 [Maudiozyma exigua]|uniref:RRM domain-containing protein n=1 Tax=Maudiozyma exigua TaxID=34358 RepID=A0A9P7BDM6_MAUEX|nr:hypothetical protein C6P45_003693 [Kazachstania exigua]
MSSEDEDFNDIYGEEPEKQQENKQDVVVEKKEEPKKEVEEPTKIDSSANEQLAALQALTSSINQAQSSASVTTEKSEPPKETSVSSGNSYTNNMPVSNTLFQQQQPPQQQPQRGGRADLSKDSSKLFIGGLNWETDEDKLKNYFSKYGNVIDLKIMRDNATGRSRGFGFLTFAEPQSVDEVVKTQHILDGKVIDPKRAIPKDEQDKTGKIFVGGIGADVRPKEFEQFFSQWGTIIDAQLMLDKDTGRSRGYGFITYDTPEAVDRVCQNKYIDFKGKKIEIKRAAPRHLQKGSSRNSGGNSSFGGHNDSGNSWSGSAGNGANAVPIGTGANNSSNNNMYGNQNMMNMNPMFNPQMMQEYYQKMQEYYTQFQNGAYAPQQGGASGQPPMPMMPNMPNMPMMPGQPQSQQQQPQASYESGSDSSSNNGGRNRDTRSNHRAHPRRQENRGYHPYK